MNCPACNSENNQISSSKKSGKDVLRIRECQVCRCIWPTIEPVSFVCDECAASDWSISEVQHDGPDRKIRRRTCKQCGNRQYTIEKKMTVEPTNVTPLR